jgi:hypothetical protein
VAGQPCLPQFVPWLTEARKNATQQNITTLAAGMCNKCVHQSMGLMNQPLESISELCSHNNTMPDLPCSAVAATAFTKYNVEATCVNINDPNCINAFLSAQEDAKCCVGAALAFMSPSQRDTARSLVFYDVCTDPAEPPKLFTIGLLNLNPTAFAAWLSAPANSAALLQEIATRLGIYNISNLVLRNVSTQGQQVLLDFSVQAYSNAYSAQDVEDRGAALFAAGQFNLAILNKAAYHQLTLNNAQPVVVGSLAFTTPNPGGTSSSSRSNGGNVVNPSDSPASSAPLSLLAALLALLAALL